MTRIPTIAGTPRLAPLYRERDLASIWFANDWPPEPLGEVKPRFMLWLKDTDTRHTEVTAEQWAKKAIGDGACFLAVFSQDRKSAAYPQGIEGWPAKNTLSYARGQKSHLDIAARALDATGLDLSGVRVITDIENEHEKLVPLARDMARGMGLVIGPKHWAVNYGTGPVANGWTHTPALDGRTTGIIGYNADGSERIDAANKEIAALKAAGLSYAVWYNVKDPTAARWASRWQRDPACRAVIGWN